jgi:hypothetical protein
LTLAATIEFLPFKRGELPRQLGLVPPPFSTAENAFRQLGYIESFLNDLPAPWTCQSIAIESHYVDKDYMEDHGVFYAKSFAQYPNHCQRVHFFSVPEGELSKRFDELVRVAPGEVYVSACKAFSDQAYLGFCVIKPLSGSPVGRTVLRLDGIRSSAKVKGLQRKYQSHICGVELTIHGLAFQQQDVAVAACATTAIWSSLQKARDHEDFGAATPAQITMLGARNAMPFGRAMPNEGLSLDQMCQAIQAVGIAPVLMKGVDCDHARGILHTCTRSEQAAILILEQPNSETGHAVCLAGIELDPSIKAPLSRYVSDRASQTRAVLVHDDRYGPYIRATLDGQNHKRGPILNLWIPQGPIPSAEQWILTQVLVPTHSKIRISPALLRKLTLQAVVHLQACAGIAPSANPPTNTAEVEFDCWFARAHRYIQSHLKTVLVDGSILGTRISREVALSRYIGVISLRPQYAGEIQILVDTTSTGRNPNFLAVVAAASDDETRKLVTQLSARCQCRPVA